MFRLNTILVMLAVFCGACSNDAGTNPFLRVDMGTADGSQPDGADSQCLGCVEDGQCVNGDQAAQCGIGGEACQACPIDQVCNEAGDCVAPPSCGRDTCDGCCDASGQCQLGTETTACGLAGLDCATCSDEASCAGGLCRQPCGPTTCAGCCDAGGLCVVGDSDDVCGAAGAACADCTTSTSECSAGQCVSTDCADTCDGCCDGSTCVDPVTATQCGGAGMACVDCGLGRTCGATGCEVDLTSMWAVVVVSGEVAAMNAAGESWDGFNGLPDPYVVAVVPNHSDGVGQVADNTLTPQWNETLQAEVSASDLLAGLLFRVRDEDTTFDDEICDIAVTLTSNHVAFGGGVVESSCPDATLGKVVWRLDALP